MWYTPIAVGAVVIVGLIVSYITGPTKPHEIDPKLIIPVGDVCCCFLPKRIRDWLRCGVNHDEEKVCLFIYISRTKKKRKFFFLFSRIG